MFSIAHSFSEKYMVIYRQQYNTGYAQGGRGLIFSDFAKVLWSTLTVVLAISIAQV